VTNRIHLTYVHKPLSARHMKRHTGEQSYKRDVCEKSFAHSHSLFKHQRLVCHSQEHASAVIYVKIHFLRSVTLLSIP
jgi:hypothetical protein